MADNHFHTLPSPVTDGITDDDIAVLTCFLVRSINRRGGLPLLSPQSSLDDDNISGLTHAPLGGMLGFQRSRKVLDALVAIAVDSGNKYLALSVGFGTTVRITIAQNDEIAPKSMADHIERVWEQLRQLAAVQKSVREANRLLDVLNAQGTSLKAAESQLLVHHLAVQELKLLKEELHAGIHRHCYMKSKQRIVKYFSPCAAFYKFYRRTRAVVDPGLVLVDVVFRLAKIARMVTKYEGSFDAFGAPVDMDWHVLAKTSSLLLQIYIDHKINITVKCGDVMVPWRMLPEVAGNRDLLHFDLLRALDKAVTLSRHIQELVSFAYSPRLCSILERPLTVLPLRPLSVEIPEPTDARIKLVVENAFAATSFAQTSRTEDHKHHHEILNDQLELIRDTVLSPVHGHTVHAEYRLLLYHHTQQYDATHPPPFQYIAVSKLACFSCWTAYKAYTRLTGRIFSLRGSHSRLCFPCCPTTALFDAALAAEMRTYLYSRMVGLYSRHLYQLQDEQNRMVDSTVASHEGETDNRLQVDLEDETAEQRERAEEEAAMDN